jgi:SSS family solute:Na+ symporter
MIGFISYWMNTHSGTIKIGPFTIAGGKVDSGTQSYLGAGQGVNGITLFFTMAASLYSGYSISGIALEAYTFGYMAVRWIPAGVALYAAFMVLAPRMHALGKARGYLTISELIYDRYSAPASSPAVPHALRIISLICLQLPVFTYLITQFSAIAVEIASYTGGGQWSGPGMSRYGTMIGAGVVMLVCGLLGGLRAVAYNDVFQGMILMVGCVVFFIIEETELGGLGGVKDYVTSDTYKTVNPFGFGKFNNVPKEAGGWSTASFASFIIKVMFAATMFPHLTMRLFVAKDNRALKCGLAGMNFTFFIVQLSTMITGWVAVSKFGGDKIGQGVFAAVASAVRATGGGGQFASALLLTAAVCAMLSTADSSLIAFSTMWLRDFYLPYINPAASAREQLIFTRCMTVVGLAVGLFLTSMSLRQDDVWNYSNLFSLQTVSPIHVAPAVWLGLHWRGLRGEAVVAGMLVGLAVTFGFTFSELNVKLKLGLDETKEGWSCAVIGLCCNLIVTVGLGLLFEHGPQLPTGPLARYARPMDVHHIFGPGLDKLCHPGLWLVMCVLIAFTTPFYRTFDSPDSFVGSMASWAFISLSVSGIITVVVAAAYMYLWTEYVLPEERSLYPTAVDAASGKAAEELAQQQQAQAQLAPVYTMAPQMAIQPMPMPVPVRLPLH